MWLIITGFWIRWVDLLNSHKSWLQMFITLQKIAATITHKVFNTSTIGCSFEEFSHLSLCEAKSNSVIPAARNSVIRVESYVTTDGQSASLSWNKAPIWGSRPDIYYCQTVAGLLMWGVLSDERMGLSFAIATGLASTVILGSESSGIRDHILLSQIRDFHFRRLLRLSRLRWRYSTPPPHGGSVIRLTNSPVIMLRRTA
jgi:hypothetical protein